MKVKMRPNHGKPAKKRTGIVYSSYNDGEVIVARRYVYPKLSEQNSKTGAITANLFNINPSEGYKQDLREYIRLYNATPMGEEKPLRTWNNLYLKLMYAMAKADPTVDLRTLTREEIYTRDLPCITVKLAVEAGLLVKVFEWDLSICKI
jgi:hypothetical protein